MHVSRHLQLQVERCQHRGVLDHCSETRYWLGTLQSQFKQSLSHCCTIRKSMSCYILCHPRVRISNTDQNRITYKRSSCEQSYDLVAYCCIFLYLDCKYCAKFYAKYFKTIWRFIVLRFSNQLGFLSYSSSHRESDCNEISAVKADHWCYFCSVNASHVFVGDPNYFITEG